jgi:hypothetical protein
MTGSARAAVTHPGRDVRVSAQWSLYPLGRSGHMDVIYRAIDRTKDATVFEAGKHFVSHLRGDLPDVFASIRAAFDDACAEGGHVTAHLTLSANSPTGRQAT